jgi:hypothetical protein
LVLARDTNKLLAIHKMIRKPLRRAALIIMVVATISALALYGETSLPTGITSVAMKSRAHGISRRERVENGLRVAYKVWPAFSFTFFAMP